MMTYLVFVFIQMEGVVRLCLFKCVLAGLQLALAGIIQLSIA